MGLFDKGDKKQNSSRAKQETSFSLEERILQRTQMVRDDEQARIEYMERVRQQNEKRQKEEMGFDSFQVQMDDSEHYKTVIPNVVESYFNSQIDFTGQKEESKQEKEAKHQIEEQVVAIVRAKVQKQFGDRITKEKKSDTFKRDVWGAIGNALMDEGDKVKTITDRERLQHRIYNLIIGLGPLEVLFDKGYSEIMVARYDKIFVEENGRMRLSDVEFASEQELRTIIDQILAPLGRVIDDAHPTVDGRLEDGSRFNAVIPPIAVDGTQLTIRRFPEKKITEEDYLKFGSLNKVVLDFLKMGVQSRWNMMVSGGTGSGKTTLLNLLSNFYSFDPGLSVVTIEDSCELKINHPNVRRYETRNANASGAGEVSAKQLVKNAMRIRPDVIIVGEIRDGVMADFLRLATSGHDGCLTTVHNNSPKELEQTIQVLFQMADDYDFTENAISRLYCAGVDVIVQIKRCADHVRRITNVTHVVGYGEIGAEALGILPTDPRFNPNKCYLKDIFVWEPWGVGENGIFVGDYVPTGYVPRELLDKARDHMVSIDESIFIRKQEEHTFQACREQKERGAVE